MTVQTLRSAIIPALLLTLAFLAGACSGTDAERVTDLAGLSSSAALERASDAVDSSNGFSFALSHVSGSTRLAGGLELLKASGTVKRPGDMKLSAEARFGRAFVRTDAVIIGARTWMTNPLTGTWAEVPPGDSPFGFFDPISVAGNIIQNVTDHSFVDPPGADGLVTIDGQITAEWFKPLVGVVADTVVDVTLFLDAETFRLEKAFVRGILQDGDAESAERLIELFDYNGEIEISPPI